MSSEAENLQWISKIKEEQGRVIRGKHDAIELLLIGLLSDGHLLFEDVPGVGKTTLAKTVARSLELDFARIQFTPDLLPADILGSNVLNPQDGTFSFMPGPIFANLVLADEINRASPRTQSALLEAMNEGQVTIDGVSRALPQPFVVIATQNPVDYQGTYPLPEAQLDRFLLSMDLGYPSEEEELGILFDRQERDPLDEVKKIATGETLLEAQKDVRQVRVEPDVAKYLLRLVRATRAHPDLEVGVSPRGALALFRASQARAMINGRDWVGPADIQSLLKPILAHRLLLSGKARYGGRTGAEILSEVMANEELPT